MKQHLMQSGLQATAATQQSYGRIYQQIQQQAGVLAYIDIIELFAIVSLLMIPLLFFMKPPKSGAAAAMH